MRGVVGGVAEERILAPARHLGVCVGLVWFARRSWGRCDAVSVLEKKRENSFSISRSEALCSVVLDPFPEKQNSRTRSWSGHLTKQTFSTGKEFEHIVHCRRINAKGSLTSFCIFFSDLQRINFRFIANRKRLCFAMKKSQREYFLSVFFYQRAIRFVKHWL